MHIGNMHHSDHAPGLEIGDTTQRQAASFESQTMGICTPASLLQRGLGYGAYGHRRCEADRDNG